MSAQNSVHCLSHRGRSRNVSSTRSPDGGRVHYTETRGARGPRSACEVSVADFMTSSTATEGVENGPDREPLQGFPSAASHFPVNH